MIVHLDQLGKEVDSRKVMFTDEPIQWHLPNTSHDQCPRCGSKLGLLNRNRRACMGTCEGGTVWEASVTADGFVRLMLERDAPMRLLPRAKIEGRQP